jgi:hypothetical protein
MSFEISERPELNGINFDADHIRLPHLFCKDDNE